jgi:hypothetical protein
MAALALYMLLYVWPTLMQARADYYLADKIAKHTAWQEAKRLRDSVTEAESRAKYLRWSNGDR